VLAEYGLLASKSSEFISEFFWQLQSAWHATPRWVVIAAAAALVLAFYLAFKKR